ncbi:MAG: hypothetical protein EBU88_02485 [Acidobacteria bacterium]|nr:hypothetical protein [Acidobacteriota bacterium]
MFSLRFKLTSYYLAILTLVLAGVGVASYIYLTQTLLTTIDTALSDQIDRIEHHLTVTAGSGPLLRMDRHEFLVDLTPQLIQIIDARGQVIDEVLDSPRFELPVERQLLAELESGRTNFVTVTNQNRQQVRLATRRVPPTST